MPSRKKQEDPWWFSPTIFDVIPKNKVYRRFNHALVQKIVYAFTKAQYPTRPRRSKSDWTEPVYLDGAIYPLICHINENNKKIVIDIRPPKKMMRKRIHK